MEAMNGGKTLREDSKSPWPDLDNNLQSLHFLVRGPGILQGLVELLYAVHIILLGQVQQLPLGSLWAEKVEHPAQEEKEKPCPITTSTQDGRTLDALCHSVPHLHFSLLLMKPRS